MSSKASAQSVSRLHAFIHHEATAGLILVVAATAAIIASNIEALKPYYDGWLSITVSVAIGPLALSKPLLLWINDGLMAVFFFLVGLEIKREVLEGNLSSRDQILLPAVAALGGMVAPALIYSMMTKGSPELASGWAIPAATDIAFALGALSLLGKRVPMSLKVFLLTLATLDDLGAIAIIALFYTAELSLTSLILAFAGLMVIFAFNRAHVSRTSLYVFVGLLIWVCVLKSGIHATLAGVAIALMVPLKRRSGEAFITELEDGLHPYVKFLILPLFAFANAGIALDGFGLANLLAPLPLAIAVGLSAGKPLGILLAVVLVVMMGFARLPEGTRWLHIVGVGCLAGIGFTMSLFIGSLAFDGGDYINQVRIGVIAGSVVSTVLGLALLVLSSRRA